MLYKWYVEENVPGAVAALGRPVRWVRPLRVPFERFLKLTQGSTGPQRVGQSELKSIDSH